MLFVGFQLNTRLVHHMLLIVIIHQPSNYKSNDWAFTRGGLQHFNFTDSWDYSGFTGTSDSASSTGMRGGRFNHNKFGGFTEVSVDGLLSSNNSWAKEISLVTSAENSGYANVSNYTQEVCRHLH